MLIWTFIDKYVWASDIDFDYYSFSFNRFCTMILSRIDEIVFIVEMKKQITNIPKTFC